MQHRRNLKTDFITLHIVEPVPLREIFSDSTLPAPCWPGYNENVVVA
jgi:hypothetical protein